MSPREKKTTSNDEIRRRARSDFVYRRLTGATISAAYGISEVTFARWKKKAKENGDDWDMARTAAVMAGEGADVVASIVLEEFMLQAQNLVHDIKNGGLGIEEKVKLMASLADSMTKMASASSKLAPKLSELGVAQSVVEELIDFVRDKFPHHIDVVQELLGPFADHIAQRFAP